jgi:hypothetical protein
MRRSLRSITLLLPALLCCAGCAAFRGADSKTPWPPTAGASKKSLSLVVASSGTMNGKPAEPLPAMTTKWREYAHDAYQESGLFSAVVPEGAPADLRAEIQVKDEGSGSFFGAFICGFTMFLIPATGQDRFTLHTEFKNAQGDVLATVEKSDTVTLWMQTFLVFVAPFKWPGSVTHETLQELHRATLTEAQAKGIF